MLSLGMFCIFTVITEIGKLLYNTTFNAFFNGKSYFWGYFCDLRPSKMAKKWSRNAKTSTPKCSFSKETQQNDRQEMDIEHGFS